MWRLIYKSAAARLESFSDNSSFPQIDDELFIAPLYIGLGCLSFRPFVHPFVCSSVKISSYSPALKRGGGGGLYRISVVCHSVHWFISPLVCHDFFVSA